MYVAWVSFCANTCLYTFLLYNVLIRIFLFTVPTRDIALLNGSNYILRPSIILGETAGQLYTSEQMDSLTLLTLNLAQPNNNIAGTYSCKATNNFGSQEQCLNIKIKGIIIDNNVVFNIIMVL